MGANHMEGTEGPPQPALEITLYVISYKHRQQSALKRLRKKMWVGRGFKKRRLFSAWVEEALALDPGFTEQVRKEGGNV